MYEAALECGVKFKDQHRDDGSHRRIPEAAWHTGQSLMARMLGFDIYDQYLSFCSAQPDNATMRAELLRRLGE